jgi:hypothetical protein
MLYWGDYMKTARILLLFLISTVLISGCVGGDKKTESISIDIPNVDEYTVLQIQGVDANGVSSEETSKFITKDKEIKSFIEKINNMEVVKPSKKEMTKKVKELNNQGNYIFVLSDSKKMDNKVYYMNFFKDGSIQFQSTNRGTNRNGIIYLSKEKHSKLIKELKSSLNINF